MDSRLKATPEDNMNMNSNDDEIDLFELWQGLLDEKKVIMASFVAVVLVATIYAFSITPVYKAEAYLLPPTAEQVLPMNQLATVINTNANTNTNTNANANANTNSNINTPESVFSEFKLNLSTRHNLKDFFDQYKLIDVYTSGIEKLSPQERKQAEMKAFTHFIKDFSIKTPKDRVENRGISVSLSLPLTPIEVTEIVNKLVMSAQQKTINKLHSQVLSKQMNRIRLLENEITSARKVALDRRLDRIAELKEAISITKRLGIKSPVTAGPTMNINNINVEGTQSARLYLLGSDLLVAEQQVLEARQNDDAFTANLRDLQAQLQNLKNVKVVKADFGVMTVDQLAVVAEKVKPKKALILAVAGVLGLMLGVFIALIRRAVKNRRQVESSVA
jgi:chain length determinant protein (polysaccharide antigen chain regulator)